MNIEHLKDPFAYRLKVNLSEVGEPEEMVVDIPETFNYLLGLKIKRSNLEITIKEDICSYWEKKRIRRIP